MGPDKKEEEQIQVEEKIESSLIKDYTTGDCKWMKKQCK